MLIKSGMSIKHAMLYNVFSAVLAYFGLVVGILAGNSETARHFILSLTAGLFLYVSLTDMVSASYHLFILGRGNSNTQYVITKNIFSPFRVLGPKYKMKGSFY